MRSSIAGILAIVCWGSALHAAAIDTVAIGKPGNAGDIRYDTSGVGSVSYAFRLATTEVTNSQYAEFLNAVAKSDPFELYSTNMETWRGGILRNGTPGNYAYRVKDPVPAGQGPTVDHYFDNKPVNFVSWYDALRYSNWLHNGKGNGDTENGAYTLLGSESVPTNANSIYRNSNARWWLPSEDEWYKSAYYDPASGGYFDYPTGTNTPPNNNWPENDSGNSANFSHPQRFNWDVISDVGAYQLTSSPFGTFDQGGNVAEWVEDSSSSGRMVRGGGWFGSEVTALKASTSYDVNPLYQALGDVGFRVATQVPEAHSLRIIAALGLSLTRHCSRRLRRPQE